MQAYKDIIARYFERVMHAATTDELQNILFDACAGLGFKFVWCGAHVNPENIPAGVALLQNYPDQWLGLCRARNYFRSNPVHQYVAIAPDGFSWESRPFLNSLGQRQVRYMIEARRWGLAHGYTFALNHAAGIKASCSFIPENGDLDLGVVRSLAGLVWIIYGQAVRLAQSQHPFDTKEQLSPRERDCLHLKAEGVSTEQIAASLTISVSTVRRHLEQAQIRLSANSPAHAVALALRQGQIS